MSGHESHGGGGGGGLHVVELAQEGAKHMVKPIEVIITQLPIALLFALIGRPLGSSEA